MLDTTSIVSSRAPLASTVRIQRRSAGEKSGMYRLAFLSFSLAAFCAPFAPAVSGSWAIALIAVAGRRSELVFTGASLKIDGIAHHFFLFATGGIKSEVGRYRESIVQGTFRSYSR